MVFNCLYFLMSQTSCVLIASPETYDVYHLTLRRLSSKPRLVV